MYNRLLAIDQTKNILTKVLFSLNVFREKPCLRVIHARSVISLNCARCTFFMERTFQQPCVHRRESWRT
jgi:hypothetical protein